MIGDRGGDQSAEKVRGDVARNIGREGARRIRGTAMLAEIGEGEREGASHEQALHDAQRRKAREPGSHRQQQRRKYERGEAQQDSAPAVECSDLAIWALFTSRSYVFRV